jgi:hypothetical protein
MNEGGSLRSCIDDDGTSREGISFECNDGTRTKGVTTDSSDERESISQEPSPTSGCQTWFRESRG